MICPASPVAPGVTVVPPEVRTFKVSMLAPPKEAGEPPLTIRFQAALPVTLNVSAPSEPLTCKVETSVLFKNKVWYSGRVTVPAVWLMPITSLPAVAV